MSFLMREGRKTQSENRTFCSTQLYKPYFTPSWDIIFQYVIILIAVIVQLKARKTSCHRFNLWNSFGWPFFFKFSVIFYHVSQFSLRAFLDFVQVVLYFISLIVKINRYAAISIFCSSSIPLVIFYLHSRHLPLILKIPRKQKITWWSELPLDVAGIKYDKQHAI